MNEKNQNRTAGLDRSSLVRFVVLALIIAGTVALFQTASPGRCFKRESINNALAWLGA